MRSQKFFSADGGWRRIAWLPSDLKQSVKDAIPSELFDKIATEHDVTNIDELTKFLVERGHPLGDKIKEAEAKLAETLFNEPVPVEAPRSASTAAGIMPLGELTPRAAETAALEIVFEGKIKIRKITLKR
jgi:CO dehydrogenase/acetyl-CoA synthase beta subunit